MMQEREPREGEVRIIGDGRSCNTHIQVKAKDGWVNVRGVKTASIAVDGEAYWVTANLSLINVSLNIRAADVTKLDTIQFPTNEICKT